MGLVRWLPLLFLVSCAAPIRAVRVEATDEAGASIAERSAALGVDTVVIPAGRVKDVLPEARKRGLRVFARVRVPALPLPEDQARLAAEVKETVGGADGVHLEGLEFDPALADDERVRTLFGLITGKEPEKAPREWKEFQEGSVLRTVETIERAMRPRPVVRLPRVPADPDAIRRARGSFLIDGYAEATKRTEAVRDALK